MTGRPSDTGFFFIRHGQTAANRDGVRSGGDSDTHLTDLGRSQARQAGAVLHRLGATPGLIVTAPLSRTLETADLLNVRLRREVRVVPDLIERRLGEWNGLSVEATQPPLAAGETPPGGESNSLFQTRVLAAFRDLAELYPQWPLIVSSRGVARILMEHAGQEGGGSLPNGAILRVRLGDRGGDTGFSVARIDHLDPPPDTA